MARFQNCVCCDSYPINAGRAVISPWVREIVGLSKRTSQLWLCPTCGSGGFSYRYSDVEMTRLYSGYRGASYFICRNRWEPSYTVDLNEGIGSHPSAVADRREVIRAHLRVAQTRISRQIESVLDVGGDRGQFIPEEIPRRVVLDVSASDPAEGVIRIDEVNEAVKWNPQAVLLCGILEHLASPKDFMIGLHSGLGKPENLVYYIEVPAGVPDARTGLLSRIGFLLATLGSLTRPTWKGVDRYLAFQRRNNRRDRFRILRQTEHLNFFSPEGLARLLEACGLEVIEQPNYQLPGVLSDSGRLEFNRVLCTTAIQRNV